MKTNLKSYLKTKLKRKLEGDDEEEEDTGGGYVEDLRKSENFEVGDYPVPWTHFPCFPGDRLQFITGFPSVAKIYDSSRSNPTIEGLIIDRLLCFSRLAMAFFNIRMASHFRVVKVLMTTANSSPSAHTHYITFQAQKRNTGSFVTFQTKIVVSGCPCPRFQILFVRIKPDHNNSQPSEFDNNAQVVEDRTLLSQLINKYTIDSRLDSQYSLALYLSQYALVCHNLFVLELSDAKHDIESLKVLKLVKPDSEVPTYLITFQASVHAETERKSVETFETKICMPTLFPTTTIELRSEARVITGINKLKDTTEIKDMAVHPEIDASEVKPDMDALEVKPLDLWKECDMMNASFRSFRLIYV